MRFLAAPLIVLVVCAADEKPKPKIKVSKETTYFTEPLDKDGYVDYQAALNARLSRGATPDTNANVLIWKALGPQPKGIEPTYEFFKQLGIAPPTKDGEYFVPLAQFLAGQKGLDAEDVEQIGKDLYRVSRRLWTRDEHPQIAAWLRTNSKPIAMIKEAASRPIYYRPLSWRQPLEEHYDTESKLPGVSGCREMTYALCARAMLHARDDEISAAWQDLLASHRLASLIGRGGTKIEVLISSGITSVVVDADLAFLENPKLTSRQVQDCFKDLRALPALADLAEAMHLTERIVMLDTLQFMSRGNAGRLVWLGKEDDDESDEKSGIDVETWKAVSRLNWDRAFDNTNRWFDRLITIMRMTNRDDRAKKFSQFHSDLGSPFRNKNAQKALADKVRTAKTSPDDATAELLGNFLVHLQMPAAESSLVAMERCGQQCQLLQLSFALESYRRDLGHYPEKLNSLTPKYVAGIPNDMFTGKPLIYGSTEHSYLLYSIGPNQKDEDGKGHWNPLIADDVAIRMPLPPLKDDDN